ncbi:MAG: hypothetical protein KDK04_16910 [Candidatus Competibacteraceae bacterium]|nr:hypothetical protein [Candidatus Competibacteraceae bacterium]
MKKRTSPIKHYLLAFVLWLGISTGVFYLIFPYYAQAILFLAGHLLSLITPTGVDLAYVDRVGITLTYPGIPQAMVFRTNLFSIALNWIFAPALVLTTVTFSFKGQAAVRVVNALLIMLVLHTLHVTLILLYFLTQATNPLIPPDFPAILSGFIHWLYVFIDKMGYTLFPFIAWLAVCFKDIVSLFDKSEADH